MTLSKEDLENTLITLANIPAQKDASLGYLPAILFTKWAADKADEPGFLESIGAETTPVYDTDLRPKELVSQLIKEPATFPANQEEICVGIEDPRDVRHHFEVLKHTIRTLGIFQIGEMQTEDVRDAFDAYLDQMFSLSRHGIYSFQPNAADIISRIAGKTAEAYDPFCKTGEILCAVDAGKRTGSEPNPAFNTIAHVRSCFQGKRIEMADDPISAPLTNADGSLRKFPLVVSNINSDIILHRHPEKNPAVSMDIHGRFSLCPDAEVVDSRIMLLHALACTEDTGRCIVVSPSINDGGIRNLRPAERTQLLENDWLEAVIQIPASNRTTELSLIRELRIMVFNKNKDQNRKGKVLFINAEECTEEARDKICRTFEDYAEIPGYAGIVDLNVVIKDRKGDLNPQSHTAVLGIPKALDLAEARQELIKIEGKRLVVLTDILDLLEEMKTE